jgi:hypothetical protein
VASPCHQPAPVGDVHQVLVLLHALPLPARRGARTRGGRQIGHADHTGCHQLAFWLALPAVRVVTRTIGCPQLNRVLAVKSLW